MINNEILFEVNGITKSYKEKGLFKKKIKREKKLAYYYTSSYKYNKYWKVLYGLPFSNFQEMEENLNFDMVLLFDSYGIPISYQLYMKEKFSEKKLKNMIFVMFLVF